MNTAVPQYGTNAVDLFQKLSKHPAVASIQGSGWQVVNGQATTREYAPGGFEVLIRELNRMGKPYSADAVIALNEERGQVAEEVVAALSAKGWRWLHANVSGSKITLWVARTPETSSFYELTGTKPDQNAGHLKNGAKRDRMASPTNSPLQGAFVTWKESPTEQIFTPEGEETSATTLWLPNGESLRVLAIPEKYNANDGDALLTKRAVQLLTQSCNLEVDEERLWFLQFLISGKDAGLKALGQTEHNVRWPEGYEDFDILIGAEGMLPRTRRDVTIGKITGRYPSKRGKGLIFVDGLETVPNALIRYFTAETLVNYGRAAAIAVLRTDQVHAIEIHEDPIQVWHAEDAHVSPPAHYGDELQNPWLESNGQEKEFGKAARDSHGSVFAHPAALGMGTRTVANRLRGMVRKATTSRDGLEGMPSAVVPGAKLKLAHWLMAGVDEPAEGEMHIGWYGDKPATFSIAPAEWASERHIKSSDSDDCDDEENATAGATEPGGGSPGGNRQDTIQPRRG